MSDGKWSGPYGAARGKFTGMDFGGGASAEAATVALNFMSTCSSPGELTQRTQRKFVLSATCEPLHTYHHDPAAQKQVSVEKVQAFISPELNFPFCAPMVSSFPFTVNLYWFWDKARSARWSERVVNIESLTFAFITPRFTQLLLWFGFFFVAFLPASDAEGDVIVALARLWQVVVIWRARSSLLSAARGRKGLLCCTHARTHAHMGSRRVTGFKLT